MNVNYDELILLTGGAFLTVYGIGKINERGKLVKTGIRVKGEVTALEERVSNVGSDTGRSINYHPIIRYMASDNEWMNVISDIGTNPAAYKEGDEVNIIYEASNYKHFIIDSFWYKLIGPMLSIVGILLMAGVGIYYMMHQL